ncbi:YqaJ viral recombinase family protein [Papillibacter cinnamivorans]|uniref:Putative phage-type endonuclease n=1 Tax=Papillibacter cinnamivorans DSM 12816 TaxID=1122930 RepID=A0A1W1YQ31_9FIRM|nr:YqaJ viral recombinase family protein [Papillibacter cinnamivorans]SMC38232.1 putative phage-type endonuclease [Papillibacter cinnamivorans DSM 12816]
MGRYENWLVARKTGIGGSDAAAIVGMNPYKTNVQLWEEKTGLREPEDISGKPYVQYGKAAEKHLRELFKLDYPEYAVSHREYQMIRHPKYPFLFASLDGRLTHRETGARGFLEVKTTNILSSMHREKWDDKIPDNYYCQCLHYFNVTGSDFCVLKAHLITEYGGERRINTRHYFMEREAVREDMEWLEGEEIKFWTQQVQTGRRPGLILPPI